MGKILQNSNLKQPKNFEVCGDPSQGFVFKSRYHRAATFLENLEKAWNFKMPLENLENLEFHRKCSLKSGILELL